MKQEKDALGIVTRIKTLEASLEESNKEVKKVNVDLAREKKICEQKVAQF